jgi:hypothetical protein
MPLSAEQQFNKATLLLDRGDVERAEALLRDVIASADASSDEVLAIRARCCLGEFLAESGRTTEAIPFLQAVADHVVSQDLDDVLDLEQRTARDLINEISGGA